MRFVSWNFSRRKLVTSPGERGKEQLRRDFSMSRCEIRTPEGRRPRRLPHGVKGNFAPRREKDGADAGILTRTPLASVSGAQQKGHGVKGDFAPRREKDPADALL